MARQTKKWVNRIEKARKGEKDVYINGERLENQKIIKKETKGGD